MKIPRLSAIFLAGAALWAGYQPTYSDSLTGIDSSKWNQIGSPSASSSGLTGQGSLISTVAVPTGNDYDIRVAIQTGVQTPCTGSYSVYARSTPDNSTTYALTVTGETIGLYRVIANSWTELSWLPYNCVNGTTMRLVVRGNSLTFWSGPNTATYTDPTPIAAGQPGVGISTAAGDTIANVQIGPIDYAAPAAINAASVQTATTANRVDMRWAGSVPDANSAGLQGYVVYRDGVYLGSSLTPYWLDQTVSGPETTTYAIYAADQHGSLSAPLMVPVEVPAGIGGTSVPIVSAEARLLRRPTARTTQPGGPSVDQLEIGVRPTGSYWGAAGENIDMLSGNLNFSIPVMKAMGRGNSSITFALSYNSQMWRQQSGQEWLLGEDVGLGLGWKLQAGSILPVLYDGVPQYYLYTDATGAQYILDQNNGSNVWSSEWGIYVWYDSNADVLHFPDGSWWKMNVVSASVEQDAGTQYPSQIEDSNGNFISISYAPAAGYQGFQINTSSRISGITDPRYPQNSGVGATYVLTWYGSPIPHLTNIANAIGTSESYSVSTASQTLLDPFTLSTYSPMPTATVLQSVTMQGLNLENQFQYDSSAELTQMTTPLGGVLKWYYATLDYTARNYRGVWKRSVNSESLDGFSDLVYIGSDGNPNWHGEGIVTDDNAWSQKTWTFGTTSDYRAGLVTSYEEADSSGTEKEVTYNWGQNSSLNPYVSSVSTTLDPGTGNAATATTTQQVDAYGNLTQQQVTDYPGSATGTRTYNMTYLAYTPYYIFNRLLTATVTPSGGSAYTLSSMTYDGYGSCGGFGLVATSATANHDSTYGTSFYSRGNPATLAGLGGLDSTCAAFDTAGVPYHTSNASGQSATLQTDPTTNYSLPTVIQPNGNSGMQTTAAYASSWAPASMTGPNGAQGTTTYDSYGRPSQTKTPDGAATTYTYAYSHGTSTQTATLDGRWQTTTLDGFGRTVQVQRGNGSTVVSTVQTQYALSSCSPLGKVYAVSEPDAPGGSSGSTTYSYDGSGRVLATVAPDGASTTTYTYQGNNTTVTDPAGKWKTSTADAYGNLVQVTEPNPAGGANLTTNYTYTPVNQLTGVKMVRGTTTQTRTFLYTGADLTSVTNPENGTTTYTYDNGHHVLSRSDAIGNKTQYSYDAYGRLSEVQYYPSGFPGGAEDTSQRVNYYYDNAVPSNYAGATPVNGLGRLTGVSFPGGVKDSTYDAHYYTNVYSYNPAGRVLEQTSSVMASASNNFNIIEPVSPAFATVAIAYQWDDEGRMTSLAPTLSLPTSTGYFAPFPTLGYQYDINGRFTTLTSAGSNYATATYTAAGQLYQLSYGGLTETNSYNSLMQLIGRSVPGYLNMTYNYSATQNNGRITSAVDGITGENTSYTYDALNRLTGATNSLWNGTYSYDGFGNLTGKSGSGGSPNGFPTMTAAYNANNQLTTASYDADGNTISMSGYTYGYTVENKRRSQTSTTYPYPVTLYGNDPNGRRVMKETNPDPNNYEGEDNPLWEFYFYTITGQKLVTIDCNDANAQYQPKCWPVGENIYFGNRLLVSNGVYVATDRLGTVRANTQGSGEFFNYYPFGEERSNQPDGRDKFATYFRDGVGQDYAQQRYYNAGMGRFWSPDPGGIRTANPRNPGSWNRYAYVNGDPVNQFDPTGRNAQDPAAACGDDGDDDVCEDEASDGGGGGAGSGSYTDLSATVQNGNVTINDPRVTQVTTVTVTATADPVVTIQATTYVTMTTSQQLSLYGPYLGPPQFSTIPTSLTAPPTGPVVAGPSPAKPQVAPPTVPVASCIFSPGFFNAVLPGQSPNTPVGGGNATIPPNSGQTNYGSGSKASGYGSTGFDGGANGAALLVDWGSDMAACLAFHTGH